jgi:class 3 adenylate cyclase
VSRNSTAENPPGPEPGTESGSQPDLEAPIDPLAALRHDLRTPAAHIQGYAEMLQEEAADLGLAAWLPDLQKIERAGRRLIEVIRQELAPERLQANAPDLRHLHAELRTPLNHAIGYSEMLLEQAEAGAASRLVPDLQRIQDAAQLFLRLLDTRVVPAQLEFNDHPRPAVAPHAQPDALALSRSPGLPATAPALSGGTVLVVDDDLANLELLARRLARQGYQVITASSGQAALQQLHDRHVDVILLDLIMPGANGDRVLAELKSDPGLREIPVIMLSALDEMDSVVRCILMGAEDYLAKPYNAVLLRARINACLEKSRLRRQEQAYLKALEIERQKSESLLRNILPQAIAERLKHGETTIVDSLAEVTVLFADVVGFTSLAHQISSVDLVRLLDEIFSEFDALAEKQGLEKIKTIGDAYMVVGGLPTPRADHASAIAELALGMLQHIEARRGGLLTPVQLRIGINSGPVVAGIIGRSKFTYDLWGDTVNLASRMESLSLPGRIQVSESVYRALAGAYSFEPRGEAEIKGRGRMPTWFLTGRA